MNYKRAKQQVEGIVVGLIDVLYRTSSAECEKLDRNCKLGNRHLERDSNRTRPDYKLETAAPVCSVERTCYRKKRTDRSGKVRQCLASRK
jgi:hypothetical protein